MMLSFLFVINIPCVALQKCKPLLLLQRKPSIVLVKLFLFGVSIFTLLGMYRRYCVAHNTRRTCTDQNSDQNLNPELVIEQQNNISQPDICIDTSQDTVKNSDQLLNPELVIEQQNNVSQSDICIDTSQDTVKKFIQENILLESPFLFITTINKLRSICNDLDLKTLIQSQQIKALIQNQQYTGSIFDQSIKQCVLARVALCVSLNDLAIYKEVCNDSFQLGTADVVDVIYPLLYFMFCVENTDPLSYSIAFELLEEAVEAKYKYFNSLYQISELHEKRKQLYDALGGQEHPQGTIDLNNNLAQVKQTIIDGKQKIVEQWIKYFEYLLEKVNFDTSCIDKNKLILITRLFFCDKYEKSPGRMISIQQHQEGALWHLFSKELIKLFNDQKSCNETNREYLHFLLDYCYPFVVKPNKKKEETQYLDDLTVSLGNPVDGDWLYDCIKEMRINVTNIDKVDIIQQKGPKNMFEWIRLFSRGNTIIRSDYIKDLFHADYEALTDVQGQTLWKTILESQNIIQFEKKAKNILNPFSFCKQKEIIDYCLYYFFRNLGLYLDLLINDKKTITDVTCAWDRCIQHIQHVLTCYPISLHLLLSKVFVDDFFTEEAIERCSVREKYEKSYIDSFITKTNTFIRNLISILSDFLQKRSDDGLLYDLIGTTSEVRGIDFTKSQLAKNIKLFNISDRIQILLKQRINLLGQYIESDVHYSNIKQLCTDLLFELQLLDEGPHLDVTDTKYRYTNFRNYILFFSNEKTNETIITTILRSQHLNDNEKSRLLEFCFYNIEIVLKVFCKKIVTEGKGISFLEQFLEFFDVQSYPRTLSVMKLIIAVIRKNQAKMSELIKWFEEDKNIDQEFQEKELYPPYISLAKMVNVIQQNNDQRKKIDKYKTKLGFDRKSVRLDSIFRGDGGFVSLVNYFLKNCGGKYTENCYDNLMHNIMFFGSVPCLKTYQELCDAIFKNEEDNLDLKVQDKLRLLYSIFCDEQIYRFLRDNLEHYAREIKVLIETQISNNKDCFSCPNLISFSNCAVDRLPYIAFGYIIPDMKQIFEKCRTQDGKNEISLEQEKAVNMLQKQCNVKKDNDMTLYNTLREQFNNSVDRMIDVFDTLHQNYSDEQN